MDSGSRVVFDTVCASEDTHKRFGSETAPTRGAGGRGQGGGSEWRGDAGCAHGYDGGAEDSEVDN